jgi:hypothetical protein
MTEVDPALRAFVDGDGRLTQMPAKRARRLLLLDWIAQRFEPGHRYPESEVNRELRQVDGDYAALRRYLVEEGFLTREDNIYWRTGGTIP